MKPSPAGDAPLDMTTPEALIPASAEPDRAAEDQVIDRLLAFEEALAAGKVPSRPRELPAELRGAFTCLEHLEQLWPGPPSKTPLQNLTPRGAAARAQTTPSHLGKFEIRRTLGEGGCGIVFLARDPMLQRDVALKVPKPEALFTSSLRERFLLEAQAAAGLDHPYVVPVYEAGESGLVCYIASAYCPGITLRSWIRCQKQEPPVRAAADLVARLAEAIEYTHSQGVLHRDLKPANVMLVPARNSSQPVEQMPLEELTPRITDFGLAKFYSEETGVQEALTRTGAVFGTPQYMSPEQAQGQRELVGPATDVYALGVILYEVLTGRVPFHALGELDLLNSVVSQEPPPPTTHRPTIHPDLETICLQCLQKNPAKRFASAGELAAELRRFLSGEPIRTRPIPRTERLVRWCRRYPTRAGLITLSFLTLFLLLPGLVWYGMRVRRAERDQEAAQNLATVAKKAEDEAQRARRAAQETALTQEYFALVHQVKERIGARLPGWRKSCLENLAKADHLATPARDLVELRSLAANCLVGLDLEQQSSWETKIAAHALAMDARGEKIAVGAAQTRPKESIVVVLNASTGEVLHSLQAPATELENDHGSGMFSVRSLAWSGEGRYLAAGLRGGQVLCWDLRAEPPLLMSWPALPNQPVDRVLFLPRAAEESQALLTVSTSANLVQRWRLDMPGKELAQRETGLRPAGVSLSPDGRTLACLNDDQIDFLDPHNLQPLKGSWRISADALRFDPLGRTLALVREGKIVLVELDTEEELRRLPDRDLEVAHDGRVDCLDFSRDGQLLISSSSAEEDRKVKIWEVSSGRLLATVTAGGGGPLTLAWQDGQRLLLIGAEKKMQRFSLQGQDALTVIGPLPRPAQTLTFEKTGKLLACGGAFRQRDAGRKAFVALWDQTADKLEDYRTYFFAGPIRPPSLAFAADGSVLLATGWSSVIYEWDLKNPNMDRQWGASFPTGLQFTATGQQLWAVVDDNAVQCWRWPEGQELHRWRESVPLPQAPTALTCLAVSNRWVVAGGRDGMAKLLSAGQGQFLRPLGQKGQPVRAAALTKDDAFCLLGSQQGELLLTRPATGEILQRRADHADSIEAIAIHRAGRFVATASRDRRVLLYELKDNHLRLVLGLNFSGPVGGLAFRPQGESLAVAVGSESAVRIVDLERLRQALGAVGTLADW